MGGLRKYMPITWITALIGSLALVGMPLFAGFFSKDAIIEAVQRVACWAATASRYFAVMVGVFVTAFYSFRMLFLAFHGKERFQAGHAGHAAHDGHDAHAHGGSSATDEEPDAHGHDGGPPHESPWVVTVPLILLAIPSVFVGWMYIEPMLFGGWFGDSIFVREPHAVVAELKDELHGAIPFILHGFTQPPFWLAVAGVATAWPISIWSTRRCRQRSKPGFAPSTRCSTTSTTSTASTTGSSPAARAAVGRFASTVGDRTIIDGMLVNGSAKLVGAVSAAVPPHPVRLRLPLRVRDDRRRLRIAVLAGRALRPAGPFQGSNCARREQRSGEAASVGPLTPYLSLAIWVPIVAGVAVLVVGRDREAVSRAGSRSPARSPASWSRSRCGPNFDTTTSAMQFVEMRRLDSALRHPLPPGRRRHLDAVRAAEQLHHGARRIGGLGSDHRPRRPVHGRVPDHVRPDDRRVRSARRHPVLPRSSRRC